VSQQQEGGSGVVLVSSAGIQPTTTLVDVRAQHARRWSLFLEPLNASNGSQYPATNELDWQAVLELGHGGQSERVTIDWPWPGGVVTVVASAVRLIGNVGTAVIAPNQGLVTLPPRLAAWIGPGGDETVAPTRTVRFGSLPATRVTSRRSVPAHAVSYAALLHTSAGANTVVRHYNHETVPVLVQLERWATVGGDGAVSSGPGDRHPVALAATDATAVEVFTDQALTDVRLAYQLRLG
jgi:hypothetical protein